MTWWKQGSHIQWCLKKAQSSRSCWKRELFVWEIHCCIHPKGTEIWEEMCYHFYVKNWECVKGSKLVCLHFLISWILSQFLRRIRNKAHQKHVHTKETILKDYVLISLLSKSMGSNWNLVTFLIRLKIRIFIASYIFCKVLCFLVIFIL